MVLVNSWGVLDVRVFVEFIKGYIFGVINLLLLNNDECVEVGMFYKE